MKYELSDDEVTLIIDALDDWADYADRLGNETEGNIAEELGKRLAMERQLVKEATIGFTACWAEVDGKHCRKPNGHEGRHAYS